MLEQEIQKKLLDFESAGFPNYIKRDEPVNTAELMVSSIVGARRSGKSFRAMQAADELVSGLGEDAIRRICYLDFDNPVLGRMTAGSLNQVQTTFLKVRPSLGVKDRLVFIFDEIHRVEGWADYLIELSRNPNWKVVVTGSSSSTLKTDLPAALRGKSFSTTIMPLSFKEFLRFNKFDLNPGSTEGAAGVRAMFDQFIRWGAFPATVGLESRVKEALLREYFDGMLLKDIIQKNNASKPRQLASLLAYLLSNAGRPGTIASALNFMKQSGYSLNREYLSEYIGWAEDCWMLFNVPLFTDSIKEQERNYKKIYCIDWAFAICNSSVWDGSYTRAFENMIYLELVRRYRRVGYYLTRSKRREVDFIAAGTGGKPELAVQVCFDLGFEDVMKRETEPLASVARHFGITDCLLINMDRDETIDLDGVKIRLVPAWRWLLE
jgi:predicted AAA+ superfamily ATPase